MMRNSLFMIGCVAIVTILSGCGANCCSSTGPITIVKYADEAYANNEYVCVELDSQGQLNFFPDPSNMPDGEPVPDRLLANGYYEGFCDAMTDVTVEEYASYPNIDVMVDGMRVPEYLMAHVVDREPMVAAFDCCDLCGIQRDELMTMAIEDDFSRCENILD